MRRVSGMLVLIGALACGGGGGGDGDDTSSIAGAGVTLGAITGIGSRVVGGTAWDANGAEIVLDGEPGFLQDDLLVGMQVVVEGERAADARSGVATRVEYDDAVEGPIRSITSLDDDTKELRVLDQTVIVRRDETRFDGVGFDTLDAGDVDGDLVEVSGPVDVRDVIHASLVILIDAAGPDYGVTVVERKGRISALDTTPGSESFMLDAVEVVYDPGVTDISEVPGGLANGQRVEVVGILTQGSPVRIATDEPADPGSIHLLTDPLPADLENVDVEGFVTGFASPTSFELDGRLVDASDAGFEPSVSGGFVALGARLAVEGDLVGGVLVAQTVRLRAGDVRIDAAIAQTADVNLADGRFALLGIPVRVDDSTVFEDRLSGNVITGLRDLNLVSGNFLAVRGIETASGVLATHVTRRTAAGAIQLRGALDSWVSQLSLTILGATVLVVPGTTAFDGDPSGAASLLFFQSLSTGELLRVVDLADADAAAIDFANRVDRQD